ncbi:hypothetical protein [Christiangramia sp. SM2212]|uniref:Uncharacterized protein n=1 Tax=Christiangramia sediminicola TaxID=3073267 RepID=A0ABU1EQ63_9FLAO|nr:hypothetical protein [Christiangramia sp. SM2212]MDR5590527.1 hypothetical protein [Christiangramia sp. SM2212]
MTQLLKKIPVLILLCLHFIFLGVVIYENRDDKSSVIFLLCLVAFLGIFYFRNFKADHSVFKRIDLLLVFLSILGAIITYALNVAYEFGAVLSAGIVGLLSSFIPLMNKRSDLLRELPVAIYCGSFAGMTAPMIANGYLFIALAGFFTGLILIISKGTLQGFGGKLGTIAFGGVITISMIIFIFS